MAFPLTPNIFDRHTESGQEFVWTGSSWDLESSNKKQELILATTNPLVTDVSEVGAIWRNTLSNEAFRYEISRSPSSIPFSVDNLTGVADYGDYTIPTIRQSLSLPNSGATLNTLTIAVKIDPGASALVSLKTFQGEDLSSSPSIDGETLFGTPPIETFTTTVFSTSATAVQKVPVDFSFTEVYSGKVTVVCEVLNYTSQVRFPVTKDEYGGGIGGNLSYLDLQFSISGFLYSGKEWNKVSSYQESLVDGVEPNTRTDGSALMEGDIWLNSAEGTWSFYNGSNWITAKTRYDPSIVNVLASTTTQSAIEELDAIVDVLSGGVGFVGSYSPLSNLVDFTAVSGYPDGVLPAANTLSSPDFLVVVDEGTGQAPAPTVPMYKGDFLIADTLSNTWIHVPIGSGILRFLDLTDTPSSYAGQGGQVLEVNSAENAIKFSPGGDSQSITSSTEPTAKLLGDQWFNTSNNQEYVATNIATPTTVWERQVYVHVDYDNPPSSPVSGQLYYDTKTKTLSIWDISTTPPLWVSI